MPALVASILYLAMPYHLTIDFYMRGAYAEVWAFVWMPIVLYFIHGIRNGMKGSVAGVATGYGVLIASHLPSALLFSPVLLVYTWIIAERNRRIRETGTVMAAVILGVGLAGIYLVPALTMRSYVSMEKMQIPELHFEKWFMLTSFLTKKMNSLLSWIALSMIFVGGYAFLISRGKVEAFLQRERAAWIVIVIGTIVMMTPISKPVWRMLPLLQSIQFPFRYNTVLCLAVAALIAIGFSVFRIGKHEPRKVARTRGWIEWGLYLCVGGTIVGWIMFLPYFVWKEYWLHPVMNAKYRDRITHKRDVPEYRPRWGDKQVFLLLADPRLNANAKHFQAEVKKGRSELSVSRWQPRDIGLRVNAAQESHVQIGQFYFPGWEARLKSNDRALPVSPSQPEGLLELCVPEGNHEIELRLAPLWPERWGRWISATSLVLLLLIEVNFFSRFKEGFG